MVRAPAAAPAALPPGARVPPPRGVGPALQERLQNDENFNADLEVLADYICVLVEQGKTREEVADELAPVMGKKATPFAIFIETASRDIISRRRTNPPPSSPRLAHQRPGPGVVQQRPQF